jgi:hypothetical protein
MSLSEITCSHVSMVFTFASPGGTATHILVPEVFEELELSVGALGQDGSRERLHDLLDCHRLLSELVLCGTRGSQRLARFVAGVALSYQTRPNAPIPTGCRSVYLW